MVKHQFLRVDLGSGDFDIVRVNEIDYENEVYYVESIIEADLHGEVYFDQTNFQPMPWLGWKVRK